MPKSKVEAAKLESELIAAISKLDSYDMERVRDFLVIIKNHHGDSSPEEELILKFVREYGTFGITPEDIEHALEDFRESWQLFAEEPALTFIKRHAYRLSREGLLPEGFSFTPPGPEGDHAQ